MILFASLLAGLAVAAVVLLVSGLPVPLPGKARMSKRTRRPSAFRHFEAEDVPARRALLICGAVGGATFLVIWAATASVFVAMAPAIVVGGLPSGYYAARGRRREKEQRSAWPDALRSLVGSLHAGRSLHEALIELELNGPRPLRPVFGRYHDLTTLAVPEAEALAAVREELGEALTDRIFEVLIIASTKGSAIALRVLNDLADAVTADLQLVEKTRTAGMEHRMQTWAVLVVPWLVLVMITARPGDYRDFYAGPAGATVLVIGSVMSLGGLVIIRALSRVKPEPRVLLTMTDQSAHPATGRGR